MQSLAELQDVVADHQSIALKYATDMDHSADVREDPEKFHVRNVGSGEEEAGLSKQDPETSGESHWNTHRKETREGNCTSIESANCKCSKADVQPCATLPQRR